MIIDFSFYLTIAVFLTGVISVADWFVFKKRRSSKTKANFLVEYAKAFFPVLLIVWIVRSFIIQPYRVPTGSLEPTVMPGDFIAVEQFTYGLRLPVINEKIFPLGEPKRGQIALFRWPKDPKIIFVKRVIGLPGDHILYKNKHLYINGEEQKQKFLYFMMGDNRDDSDDSRQWRFVPEKDLIGRSFGIWMS